MSKKIKNLFKKYWYYAGQWHNAECDFIQVDASPCNCNTYKNNLEINKALT